MSVERSAQPVRYIMHSKPLRSSHGAVVCRIGRKNSCKAVWVARFVGSKLRFMSIRIGVWERQERDFGSQKSWRERERERERERFVAL